MYAFLITLREGLEAALILGVILAYLARTGNRRQSLPVWLGAGLALSASAVAGVAVFLTRMRLGGVALELFEGIAMLVAAGVLTYVIVWMRRQSRYSSSQIQSRVDAALRRGSPAALAALSFVVLFREGVETVLFLGAGAGTSLNADPGGYWAASLVGALLSILLGAAAYRGSLRLPLGAFFGASGVVLILFAAGMIANGFRELEELQIVSPLVTGIWDTYGVVPDTSPLGTLLTTLFGYDSSPSLTRALSFFGYVAVGLVLYFKPAPVAAGHPPKPPFGRDA